MEAAAVAQKANHKQGGANNTITSDFQKSNKSKKSDLRKKRKKSTKEADPGTTQRFDIQVNTRRSSSREEAGQETANMSPSVKSGSISKGVVIL
jgi:hypothetical protein